MWKVSPVIVVAIVLCMCGAMGIDSESGSVNKVENSAHSGDLSLDEMDGFQHDFDALGLHLINYSIALVHFNLGDVDPNKTFLVWMKTDVCIGCKLLRVAILTKNTDPARSVALIDTAWATRIRITTEDTTYPSANNTYCELWYHFGQNGEYNLSIPTTIQNGTQCGLRILKESFYENTAVLVYYGVFVFGVFVAAIWFHCMKRRVLKNTRLNHNINTLPNDSVDDQTPLTDLANNKPTKASLRLKSVDAFRGLAIFYITQGTSGDGHYWFLQHSGWYGISVADFIFPWFVFVMGTSIHLSFNILLSKGCSYRSIFKKLVFRSLSLFMMGVCIQPHNDLLTLRIPGVLQRFGITYFIVASSYLISRRLQARRKESTSKCYMVFRDVTDYIELPLAACCLIIHLLVTFLLPVPGCPLGYQGPGGPLVGVNGELTNCTGGASGYIDRMLFTPAHIIPKPKAAKIYHTTLSVDPEGILGTFTSIVLCAFGLQAGKILHLFSTVRGRVLRLLLWGLALITWSAVLTKCDMADGWIPLNKTLWSVSYITLTGGLAFVIQALFHVLIDATHFWNGAPLIYLGMNSILIYIGVEIMHPYLPFTWQPLVGNHTEYAILGAWSSTIWLIIAYVCHRKKIFLKL